MIPQKVSEYLEEYISQEIYVQIAVIKGKENIITDQKFFIAASHQSMFETFYLQVVFNSPVFILKKELLQVPIFGWYLKKIGSISINRNKVSRDNLGFFEDILKTVNTNTGETICNWNLKSDTLLDSVRAGGRINLIIGKKANYVLM